MRTREFYKIDLYSLKNKPRVHYSKQNKTKPTLKFHISPAILYLKQKQAAEYTAACLFNISTNRLNEDILQYEQRCQDVHYRGNLLEVTAKHIQTNIKNHTGEDTVRD